MSERSLKSSLSPLREALESEDGMPLQLPLFGEAPAPRLLTSVEQTEEAVSEALARGWTVRLRRAAAGFELALTPPSGESPQRRPAASTKGFTRRVGERLLEAAAQHPTRLWARPAGAAWPGWMEWGTLPAGD